jgi:hypothetical protein
MSLSASGTFGKTITFSIWKGQAYGRLRVIPINRNSAGQQTVRSVLGALAKAARAVLTITNDVAVPAVGSQFFQDAVAVAPAGQSWLSYMQKVSNSEFAGNVSAYGALDGTHKGYWVASATDIGLGSYIDKAGVTHTGGELLFLLAKFAVGYLTYTEFATTPEEAVAIETDAFAEYVNTTVA